MKALTIIQPWASHIAEGRKECETRSWPTKYRGPLLIHAGKNASYITEGFEHDYPLGAVIAVATMVECVRTESIRVDEQERELGDWTPGRYAWKLADVRRLEQPIPWRGAQSLWQAPPGLLRSLNLEEN